MIFSVSLKRSQIIGIILISICVALISLRDVIIPTKFELHPSFSSIDLGLELRNETIQVAHSKKVVIVSKVPTIVPIMFALMTPIAFSISGELAKHMSQERIGFDSNILSFTSQILINSVIVILGIVYWNRHGVILDHLLLGLLSGITESMGKALI